MKKSIHFILLSFFIISCNGYNIDIKKDPTPTSMPPGKQSNPVVLDRYAKASEFRKRSLSVARSSHSAVTFSDTASAFTTKKVMIIGGQGWGTASNLSDVEVYDPKEDTFVTVDSLATARKYHTSVLLNDGRIMVIGGQGNSGNLNSVEIYNPSAQSPSFSSGPSLNTKRYGHTATVLSSGKVVVIGGYNSGGVVSSIEVWDPSSPNSFSVSNESLDIGRFVHAAVAFNDGSEKIMVSGGQGSSGFLSSVEIYDPVAESVTLGDPMTHTRRNHTASVVKYPNNDEKVIIIGGFSSPSNSNSLKSIEVFDSSSKTFDNVTLNLQDGRRNHTAVVIKDGRIMIAGGWDANNILDTVEFFNPKSTTKVTLGPKMATKRWEHTAVVVDNSGTEEVMIAGGGGFSPLSSIESFIPSSNSYLSTAALVPDRGYHTTEIVKDSSGKKLVVVIGGEGSGGILDSIEVYDPAKDEFFAKKSLATARYAHASVVINHNGTEKVMIIGGYNNSGTVSSIEIYNPWNNTFESNIKNLKTKRFSHSAVVIDDGSGQKVMIAGGHDGSNYLSSVEIYDPSLNVITYGASLSTSRFAHTATVILDSNNDEKVVLAGGYNGSTLSSVEVYDSVSNSVSAGLSLPTAAYTHTATVVDGGKQILFIGGSNGSPLNSASLYDFASSSPTHLKVNGTNSLLSNARHGHTATLKSDGTVLICGGQGSNGILKSVEIYSLSSDSFSNGADLAVGRRYHSVEVLDNDDIFIIGGYSNGWEFIEQ
jgi:N-acetylneuraminic acid mutarotase